MLTFIKKNWQILLFLTFICYGLFLRYERLDQRSFWTDEKYQVKCIQNALAANTPFWSRTATYGDHTSFPGEYITTGWMLKKYGADKWMLLIPHLILNLLGFFFLFFLLKHFIRSPDGWAICLLIFMVNGNSVYYAFEYRPYAVLPTLVLGMLFIWVRIFYVQKPQTLWEKIGIWLFMLFTSIYHAYSILFVTLPLLAVIGIKYMEERDMKDILRRGIPYFAPLCLSFFAWGWYASANFTGTLKNSTTDTFQFIANPMERPWKFFKGTVGNITGAGKDWLYPTLLAPTVMTWIKHPQRWSQIWFLCILVILPFAAILLVDVVSHYWFIQRQFIWIIPLWALYIGWSWDSFIQMIRQRFKQS